MSFFWIFVIVLIFFFTMKAVRVIPQQSAWIVERLGSYKETLEAGLHFVIPIVDRIAYKHDLREVPLDVPSQICITRDNTQLQVDGILYFQITDPKLASYGTSNYILAITQLAQTTLRSVIGKMELDKTFEDRDVINRTVIAALDDAAINWGVKVLRYEIKDLTPPKEILHAMQRQITAEREKRALIAASEGRQQEQINLALGERESSIQRSQGDMQAAINKSEGDKQAAINKAIGEAEAIRQVAGATAEAIARIAQSIQTPGGVHAINLKVAEQYVQAFSNIAKTGNTMILPSNATDIAQMVGTAMSVFKTTPVKPNP